MAFIRFVPEAELAPEDRVPDPDNIAMVDYAVKLTRSPWDMKADDVEALRQHSLDDRSIRDLCAIVAYFNFVNRLADGLGVELERT